MTPSTASAARPGVPDSDSLTESQRHRGGLAVLTLGALGVVFGDIGTSPLYSLQTVFSLEGGIIKPTRQDIVGIISLVIWTIMIIVTVKYVMLVMRADNDGEGGILALVALLKDKLKGRRLVGVVLMLGIIGAGLFYGDSFITPAISVMSAIEGLELVNPSFGEFVIPASVVILTVLFAVQRWGTGAVGKAFGPVMTLWYTIVGVLGVPHILLNPQILVALSPHWAIMFFVDRPFIAFVAMGAVVLTITGAEALYADMGHFGAAPIRAAWAYVFVMLLLNYLGQGALLLQHPEAIDNPFFRLAPSWAMLPLVIMATAATVIASQAVISGAFSVSRQATRLRLLPRLEVKQTSKEEGGQIYVPTINWILFMGVLLLIGVFQSSQKLATAYGLAVTGTLLLTTTLFLILARYVWRWSWWVLIPTGVVIGVLEALIFAANVLKLFSGGWLPLAIAAVIMVIMTTWRRGSKLASERRESMEGSLEEFVDFCYEESIPRIPGLAVYPHPPRNTTPLALRGNVDFNRVLHEHIVIMSIVNENVPHIRHVDRARVRDVGYVDEGIVHVDIHVGFNDSQDIPKALALALERAPEVDVDVDQARYFLSTFSVQEGFLKGMPKWRRMLYVSLQRNAGNRAAVFHLPPERTVVMGADLES